jgi:quercetin dioxygenase-like cupin family protein
MSGERYPKLERRPLFELRLPDENPQVRTLKAARIRFAPGQPTGVHRHAMSTCGVVTAGRFILEVEGEETRELVAGDAFFEPAGRTIRRFDNASDQESAEIVAFFLSDDPQRALIEMLDGGMNQQLGIA